MRKEDSVGNRAPETRQKQETRRRKDRDLACFWQRTDGLGRYTFKRIKLIDRLLDMFDLIVMPLQYNTIQYNRVVFIILLKIHGRNKGAKQIRGISFKNY